MSQRLLARWTAFAAIGWIAQVAAADPLPRSTPEAQGLPSGAVGEFAEALNQIPTMHSFMVLRHGQVIAEAWWKPEAADKAHILNSVSKSFTSTAVGMAVAEGKLSLEDKILKFFPDEAPAEPSENLKAMTVKNLLTMNSGHEVEPKAPKGETPSVKTFLAAPVEHVPGTHFQYNTMGTYTLSAIITKVTGQTTLEYLKPRLFAPLGIEDPKWDASAEGNSLGGYGLYLRTEDVAKLGQLYLQKGKWQDKQLIPESWVAQASSKQVPNDPGSHVKMGDDWRQGYGFQFWPLPAQRLPRRRGGRAILRGDAGPGCGDRDDRRQCEHAGGAGCNLDEVAAGFPREGAAGGYGGTGEVEGGDRKAGGEREVKAEALITKF